MSKTLGFLLILLLFIMGTFVYLQRVEIKESEELVKINYEQYFLIGYLRSINDKKEIDKYTSKYGKQNLRFYMKIVLDAVRDIRNQIYDNIECPVYITLEK